ncbi:MAG: hypothetical protein ACJAQV_000065 [Loktanella salsilacus]|jgi:hypothetical protein
MYYTVESRVDNKRGLRPIGILLAGIICDEVSLTLSPS